MFVNGLIVFGNKTSFHGPLIVEENVSQGWYVHYFKYLYFSCCIY